MTNEIAVPENNEVVAAFENIGQLAGHLLKQGYKLTPVNNHGFRFEVGNWVVSVQVGPAHYCDNRYLDPKRGLNPQNYDQIELFLSPNAEVGVWHRTSGKWNTEISSDGVLGWQSSEEILALIDTLAVESALP